MKAIPTPIRRLAERKSAGNAVASPVERFARVGGVAQETAIARGLPTVTRRRDDPSPALLISCQPATRGRRENRLTAAGRGTCAVSSAFRRSGPPAAARGTPWDAPAGGDARRAPTCPNPRTPRAGLVSDYTKITDARRRTHTRRCSAGPAWLRTSETLHRPPVRSCDQSEYSVTTCPPRAAVALSTSSTPSTA
jgi:hypothetical protein